MRGHESRSAANRRGRSKPSRPEQGPTEHALDHYDALLGVRDALFGLRCAITGASISNELERAGLLWMSTLLAEQFAALAAEYRGRHVL